MNVWIYECGSDSVHIICKTNVWMFALTEHADYWAARHKSECKYVKILNRRGVMEASDWAPDHLQTFIYLEGFFGKAQSGAFLSTGDTHEHYAAICEDHNSLCLMLNCASFSLCLFCWLSLKCIHDIFNVTMVLPSVLVSVMGELLLRACQLLYLNVWHNASS